MTHQAYRLHAYGGPEVMKLDEVPVPQPGEGQVLVKISFAGINPFDWKIREGYVKDVMPLPLPAILGVDFAGEVVKLGSNTKRLQIGDRVMTMSQTLGAFAQHIVVSEDILAKVPDSLTDEQAASLPIPVMTAWLTLHKVGPVKSVLIHGASGICGAFAVQFAKDAGAKVYGTASGKNRDYVLGLGADEFIDYQTEKFEDRVKDIDLVLDYVLLPGADSTVKRSWAVLNSKGAIVSAADPMVAASAPEGRQAYFADIKPDVEILEKVAERVAAGDFKSKIAKIFERNDLIEAMELNKAGGSTGRLLVKFN